MHAALEDKIWEPLRNIAEEDGGVVDITDGAGDGNGNHNIIQRDDGAIVWDIWSWRYHQSLIKLFLLRG